MSDWFDNDGLFFRELREGHRQAERVAARLREEGIRVEVTPMEVRAGIQDRGLWADEYDMLVGAARPCPVDVKSRNLEFSGPGDYPYATALVDTASGWQRKTRKPLAIVLVSQRTDGIAVIRVSGADRWLKRRRFDRIRRIEDDFYEVAREELATFEDFVTWLHSRETASVSGG